jgi:hypothetical protein
MARRQEKSKVVERCRIEAFTLIRIGNGGKVPAVLWVVRLIHLEGSRICLSRFNKSRIVLKFETF